MQPCVRLHVQAQASHPGSVEVADEPLTRDGAVPREGFACTVKGFALDTEARGAIGEFLDRGEWNVLL